MIADMVIVADPEDAARITRVHVGKMPNLTPFFFNSIISTTVKDHWDAQRRDLVDAFLPVAKLRTEVFPVLARAKVAEKLLGEASKGGAAVDMNDFLLNETKAQLMLAMLGTSQEFMDAHNKQFRDAMSGKTDPAWLSTYVPKLFDEMKGCPVGRGPLAKNLCALDTGQGPNESLTHIGNAMIFSFAGHDTTGHTISWLLYELCRNPAIQARLHKEVDAFLKSLGSREMVYGDLNDLPFMTRCITETLRLWPAVANGTFRQTSFDDYVKGKNGEDVRLPKGTFCVIPNWSRHRNPDLWGQDAHVFNPDRTFHDAEMWHGNAFKAYNPSTTRFSPFTYAPRDCIGKTLPKWRCALF